MPKPNTIIKLTNKFNKLNIDNLNVQPKCKFLLRCMRSVKKNKKGHFNYKTLINFMLKNKDNNLYYRGKGITSIQNLYNYWNYAHSHKTAFIPNFNKMYDILNKDVKKVSFKKSNRQVININISLN